MITLLGYSLALLGIGLPAFWVWRGWMRFKMRRELADIICRAFYHFN